MNRRTPISRSLSRRHRGDDSFLEEEEEELDEIVAPAPIQNPDESADSHLEDVRENELLRRQLTRRSNRRYSSVGDVELSDLGPCERRFSNFNEIACPSPEQNRRQPLHLQSDLAQTRLSIQRSRTHESQIPSLEKEPSRVLEQIYVFSYLVFFSILGTLARIGLQTVTKYPNAPVTISEVWSNFGGCIIMGYLSEDRILFLTSTNRKGLVSNVRGQHASGSDADIAKEEKERLEGQRKEHHEFEKSVPLYIGLSVGFAGSWTSFSSFIRDLFLAISNDLPPGGPRNGADSLMAALAVLIVELSLSFIGLTIGGLLAIALEPILLRFPLFAWRYFFDPAAVVLGWGAWIGAVIMAIWPPDRPDGPQSKGSWEMESWRGQVIFALVFAPLGCLLRSIISMQLNRRFVSFPLGTFTVNILGTLILGVCWDLQRVKLHSAGDTVGGGRIGCQVLQGLQDGFCGALTTVSTWILELKGLSRRHSYLYGLMNVVVALILLVIIMGEVRWTTGFGTPGCKI